MNDSHNTRGHMATQPGIRGHSAGSLFAKTGVVIFHRIGRYGFQKWAMFPDGMEIRVMRADPAYLGKRRANAIGTGAW